MVSIISNGLNRKLKNPNAGEKYPKANLKGNKHKEIKQTWQEILWELLAISSLDLWFPTTVYLIRAKGKEIPVGLTHNISEHKRYLKQISSISYELAE